jgi:hypothetical protein
MTHLDRRCSLVRIFVHVSMIFKFPDPRDSEKRVAADVEVLRAIIRVIPKEVYLRKCTVDFCER